jgi:hypothetical protein
MSAQLRGRINKSDYVAQRVEQLNAATYSDQLATLTLSRPLLDRLGVLLADGDHTEVGRLLDLEVKARQEADALNEFHDARCEIEHALALRQIVPPVSPAPNPAIPVPGETSIPSGSTDPSPSVDHNTGARAFYSEAQ